MKQIVILSGKGGTGKTTVAAAVAHLSIKEAEITIVDADVDAPILLLLSPEARNPRIRWRKVAAIDQELCTDCGICVEVCRFEAVSRHP